MKGLDDMLGAVRGKSGVILLAMVTLIPATAKSQTTPVGEYEVKAAFLYNFARFVQWPDAAFRAQGTRLQICVFGPDPFGEDLEDVTHDKVVNGHQLLVKDVTDLQQAKSCHILFIALSQKLDVGKILEGLAGTSVLTVSEAKGFVEKGGMVSFILQDKHVQFEVNHREAKRAGLVVSSRLLSVAKAVIE